MANVRHDAPSVNFFANVVFRLSCFFFTPKKRTHRYGIVARNERQPSCPSRISRTFTLSVEEETALLDAIAEADRGELLDADDVLGQLP